MVGHGQVRQIDRNAHLQHLRTDAAPQGGYPWVAFLASLTCGGLWWAIQRGQFEDIEAEGERILRE